MKTMTLFAILILVPLITFGQNLVVDGAPVLLPRLTTAQRDLIAGPSGMVIFNSTEKKFQGFVGGGDPIESTPPTVGVSFNMNTNLIVLAPNQSGILGGIELYTESAGVTGSLHIISMEPCEEFSVLSSSNSVTTSVGWNTYTFTPPLSMNNGSTYYIGTKTGTVNANSSQSDNLLLQRMLWNGGATCTLQVSEIAAIFQLQGSWVNLH
ncbi:MAG: hypothetical protein IPL46_33320 [Saprospiraceae bacterium]|nr:hypothetical protein [Saprospiraceae bacterium]